MENNIIEDNILSVNTQNSRMKIISIEGNEKQDTREGYNLLNLKDWEINETIRVQVVGNIEENKVGLKTNSSTASSSYFLRLRKTLSAGTYYFERKFKTIEEGLGGDNYGLVFLSKSDWSKELFRLVPSNTGKAVFTLEEETTVILSLVLKGTSDAGTEEREIEYYDMMLSYENKEYEKYGAMPSFDYPSEIKTVGDNINVFNDEAYKGFVVTQQNYNALEKVDLHLEANKYYVAKIYFEDGTSVAVNNSNFMLCAYKADGTQSANIPNQIAKSYANATKLVKAKIVANSTGLSTYANKVIKGIKIEEVEDVDGQPSSYSNYGQGCIELNITNKNILDVPKNSTVTKAGMTVTTDKDGILTLNGTTTSAIYIGLNKNNFIMQAGNLFERSMFRKGNYNFSVDNLSSTQTLNASAYIRKNYNSGEIVYLESVFSAKHRDKNFILEEDKEAIVYLWIASGITLNNAKLKFQIELDNATDIVTNEEQKYIIPVQQRMFSGDKFVKINGVWKEMHTWLELFFDGVNRKFNQEGTNTSGKYRLLYRISEKVKDCDTTNGTKAYCSNSKLIAKGATYSCNIGFTVANNIIYMYVDGREASEINAELQDNPITFYIPLQEDSYQYLDCTPEQVEILDKIIYLYDGISNIYFEDDLSPTIEVEIKKIVEDYDAYISTNGYLIIPEYNIKYLINLNESTIPSMPEATETSIKVAGRDGDVPLNTTYEPISFDLVCYTEDNLSVLEKSENEAKVNLFLNSIKNKTKKFAIERDMKFYDIKYNGSLTRTNYPAHLKFSIPFKSSESYAKDLKDKMIIGNSTEESNTISSVGALFTIRGPATMPIISLNDYSMEYNTSILEGARIEIDSNKSTITHINSDGVKTNVMKHYNHQFPKIEKGNNTLKILSGINSSSQVNVKWRDLKL